MNFSLLLSSCVTWNKSPFDSCLFFFSSVAKCHKLCDLKQNIIFYFCRSDVQNGSPWADIRGLQAVHLPEGSRGGQLPRPLQFSETTHFLGLWAPLRPQAGDTGHPSLSPVALSLVLSSEPFLLLLMITVDSQGQARIAFPL